MRTVMTLLYSFRLKWLYHIHTHCCHCGYGMITSVSVDIKCKKCRESGRLNFGRFICCYVQNREVTSLQSILMKGQW